MQLLAAYRQHEDMISIGAYQSGTNPLVDVAIQLQEPINRFLQQGVSEPSNFSFTVLILSKIVLFVQLILSLINQRLFRFTSIESFENFISTFDLLLISF